MLNHMELVGIKKVALVGATNNEAKYGYIILKYLLENTDYMLFPVNPNLSVEELLGLKVYPSLRNISDHIDLVVAVVPPKITREVLMEAIELGIPNFWCQPGAESSELKKIATGKIQLVMDKCIMVELNNV